MIIVITTRELSSPLRETLTEIEYDPELSRPVTVLESLWVAEASADQAATLHVFISGELPHLDDKMSELAEPHCR